MEYTILANDEVLNETIAALASKNIEAIVVNSKAEALEKIKELIPAGASVMNGSSTTLEQIGYIDYLKDGNHGWNNLHEAIVNEQDKEKQAALRKQALLSDFYLGSVHALMQNGEFIIASNTGSQLPHVVYSSQNLIFVVSTKKIVPTLTDAMNRLQEHVIPLEDKRMMAAYGIGTMLNKIVIFKGENPMAGRKIRMILIKEDLGF